MLTRSASYAWCERLTRIAAGNFYPAFRILPTDQRRAMCALYAFLRIADDLGDAPLPVEEKRQPLAQWRDDLHAAIAGEYRHPVFPALHDTISRFCVPLRHLEEVLDGVCMDLDVCRYEKFAELYRYCYLVASAVGLACVRIWGLRGPEPAAAEAAGVALQLTNILRDLGEDAARGRVYLPREELAHFGCEESQIARGEVNERFRDLMRFQVQRAASYYDAALPLAPLLPAPGRAVFLVILRTYRGLLDGIVARNYDVFSARVRLSRWAKFCLVLRALPVRWGWKQE